MSIQEIGIEGEKKARIFLKNLGYKIFQIDWMADKDGNYIQCEVKFKERFTPPPFEGHGMEIWKIKDRLRFEKQTGIKAFLIIFEKLTDLIFYQWLLKLEQGKYFDTKNDIRIYPLENFKTGIKTWEVQQ